MKKYTLIALALTAMISSSAFADYDSFGKDKEQTGPFSGGAEANLNMSTGNTDIKTFGASLFGDYKSEVWTTRAKFNYMRNVTDAAERALRYSGSLRLGANVTNNLDFFALGTYMNNKFVGIDDQWMVTPGLSAYAVNNDEVSIRFEVGAGWMKENYFAPSFAADRSFSVGTGGVGLRFKLSDVADITDDAVYILPFSTTDDWRINNVAALTTAVTKVVALKLSYTIERRNIAVGLRQNTDTYSMASVVVKF